MAFAWPLAARDFLPRARATNSRNWWRAVVPALLVCAGAFLLAPPWNRPAPANAPAATPSPLPLATGAEPLTLVGALLVIGGALVAMPWLLARVTSRTKRGGLIELVEVRPLGGKQSLMLVQVGCRRFLLGATEHGMSALAELDAAKSFAEVASEAVGARAASPAREESPG